MLLDLDSTILGTYGHQEGDVVNFHYQSHGYHPLVCYDGMTGDLLKIELRNGTDYFFTGVQEFLQPLLDEFQTDYPELPLLLRGDSGLTMNLDSKRSDIAHWFKNKEADYYDEIRVSLIIRVKLSISEK